MTKLKLTLMVLLAVLLCGCNITYVEVHKKVYIFDGENLVEITGSELRDNTNAPKADGDLSIPTIP